MGITTTYRRAFKTKKLDPYPVEILKRVERPITVVREGEIRRVDERESGDPAEKILEVVAQKTPSKAARLMREDILNGMQKLMLRKKHNP